MIDSNKIIRNILGTGKTKTVRPMRSRKALKPLRGKNSKKRTNFSNYQKMKLRQNIFNIKDFNKFEKKLDKNLMYIEWRDRASKLKNKVEKLGYPVQSIGIKSIGMDLSRREMTDNLKEHFDHFPKGDDKVYKTPIDLYADIPINSKLGKIMQQSKYKLNPKDWWIRLDYDNEYKMCEILYDGCTDYQDSDYTGYIFEGPIEKINKIIAIEESF